MRLIALSELPPGTRAVVDSIGLHGAWRRRLLDLGLTRSATVCTLFGSPFGDPRAYKICESMIALRNSEASQIMVTPLESDLGA